ncbi:PAN domain protein, partial [Ostertagia ostertagi]
VTPGLSCTFTLFKGASLTNVNINPSAVYYNDDVTLEDCFKECHEKPDCKAFLFYGEDNGCEVLVPGEDGYHKTLSIKSTRSIETCPSRLVQR